MRAALLAIAFAMLLSETASACTIPHSLSADQQGRADSVFFGRIASIEYAATELTNRRVSDRSATITFDVQRTVRGRPLQGSIEVYGFSNTGNRRVSLEEFVARYGRNVYVGIVWPDTIKSHTTCRDDQWKNGSGEKLRVPYCKVDLPIVPFGYKPADAPRMDRPRVIEDLCGDQFIRTSRPRDLN